MHGRYRLDHRAQLTSSTVPLALCASTVIYEGVPTYPDAGRCLAHRAKSRRQHLPYSAPTAIRALRKVGPDEPAKYNYNFKHMTTVGEPIEPEVWKWYHKEVGKGEAIIVDTWWQTETGGFLCSTLPGITPMKPGSAGPGMPGIHPIIYDDEGNEVPRGSGKAGNICIQNPWPGMFQTIWGDRDRFVDTYFAAIAGIPKARIGVTGRISPEMPPSRPRMATIGSWAASMT